jgi:hypothetical protein
MATMTKDGFKIIQNALSGIYELKKDSIKTKIIMEKNSVIFMEYSVNDAVKVKHSDKQKIIFDALSEVIELPKQAMSILITMETNSTVEIISHCHANFRAKT